jgi:hypothetical protein
MFTGALAASYYGIPRTTVDVDLLIKFTPKDTEFLVTQLKKAGLSVNRRKIELAFKSGFKIVTLEDEKAPFTVDVILSDKKLEKRKGEILGIPTYYQTAEALILAKLRMIKVTIRKEKALKDKDDVRAILRHMAVNLKTLKKKAKEEKTISILDELLIRKPS